MRWDYQYQDFNMGMYNILEETIECSSCQEKNVVRIQFSFGDTWLFTYQIGDKIRWGGKDKGRPNLSSVKVYGLAENAVCSVCGWENVKDYDILIQKDIIQMIQPMESYSVYLSSETGGDYVILKE